ncbi:AMP-binding protein [Streptomyces massasporeus]|uniref:AMP-binding protein n=1 Tax=Streptomyces massasporeus TaxID=67324 RepID=UPI00378FC50B
MFRSEYADVPPVDLPIHDAVLARAAEFGDTPALIDGTDGTTLSYEQVDRFHRRVAAALAEAGVRKGDVLTLHSPNTIAFPTAFYAATRAGATVTTVHPLATADEFAKQLRDSGARLHTGDVGYADDGGTSRSGEAVSGGGWLFVVDRVKELIKYKGFQVAPAEPEALLLTHPGIADAAVIGRYDADGNEVPHAYVVRRPSAGELTEAEIMMYVAERVAPYKRIRHVTFIVGVPRAASGKILRRQLRESA